jgi:hypothetical protein
MSNNLDLTIIAIAVAVMAIMAIVILWLMIRLLLRLMALEHSMTQELKSLSTDVREMMQHVRHTSDRVSETVGHITRTVTWLGRIASVVTSFSRGHEEPRKAPRSSVPDPGWWLTGLKWGLSLISNRRQSKSSDSSSGPPAVR